MFSVWLSPHPAACLVDRLLKGSIKDDVAYLVDEHLRTTRTHEQHGPPQSVPVPVELLSAHRVEEVSEDSADVVVHSLQRHIQTQPRPLIHKGLQTPDV